jgi:hypothetical protein
MPKVLYVEKRFSPGSESVIDSANGIIAEYLRQGFKLTLRQLYYQFVARGLLANTVQNYKRLGSIVNDARLAGRIDWEAIEDRTRNLAELSHWRDPGEIVEGAAYSYRLDKWASQPYRVEVWIEKEALAGVFEAVCQEMDIPYLSCRGYTSQSEMWGAAQRLKRYVRLGQAPIILHFGDHDPSGIDMTRDIRDRMATFGCDLELRRLALNMDQVEQYDPPPNPAKETDSRFAGYIAEYGDESWELDALEPAVLADLVRSEISGLIDQVSWDEISGREDQEKSVLELAARNWEKISRFLLRKGHGSEN